jgi:hypothetical protein
MPVSRVARRHPHIVASEHLNRTGVDQPKHDASHQRIELFSGATTHEAVGGLWSRMGA